MKNLRRAAIAAVATVALLVVSSSLFAQTSGWAFATSFNSNTSVVTGITHAWQVIDLRHDGSSQHQFISNPDLLPAGPCRSIGHVWNIFVAQNRSESWFNKLLKFSAHNQCSLTFVRGDQANADGSFTLIEVAPSP